jgi:hypothetical protein
MNTTKRLLLLGAVLMVTGCGGGSSPSPGAGIAPPPINEAPGGLWFGTLSFDSGMITEEFVAMTTDDGRFRFVSVDSEVHFVGQGQVSGASLNGTARVFADSGLNWLDGNHVVDATVTAVLTARDSISGGWATASGESGTFEFFYDPLNDRDSATTLLEAVWTGYDEFGNPVINLAIDSSGSLSGQNAQGCVSAGQLTVIDPEFNLYEIHSEISGCFIAGSYSGFAFLGDLFAVNDAMVVSIDDGERTILLGLQR